MHNLFFFLNKFICLFWEGMHMPPGAQKSGDDLWESGLPSALWVPGIDLKSSALVEEPLLPEPLCQSTRLPFKF